MDVSEAILIELCNAQRDVGMLTERMTWLEWRLEQVEGRDRELIEARLKMAEMQLSATRTALSKLHKEMYG